MDYEWLKNYSIQEIPHKQYLNDYLAGKYPEAVGRGELYNSDPMKCEDSRYLHRGKFQWNLQKKIKPIGIFYFGLMFREFIRLKEQTIAIHYMANENGSHYSMWLFFLKQKYD